MFSLLFRFGCQIRTQAGADANSKAGPHDSTPLHIAARCGHHEIAVLLLENGADVNAKDGLGETPLMRAIEGHHEGLAKWLLSQEADSTLVNNVRVIPCGKYR